MSIKGLNMIGPHHICVLYVATAGLQGPLMGSDEQEIVLLIYVIIDSVQNQVRYNLCTKKSKTKNIMHIIMLDKLSFLENVNVNTCFYLPFTC